ncbi:AraC family transcriptional regulator [Flavobacterium fluviatile]|uniref:AraC family transcriptional regulator n=1 Tax=Flavobacterium fluviatile TaxID=1862387 RepID=UPI0013D059A1|nr:AraC family transcriptional regulator [Flavobacterium fluviatile]
MKLHLLNRTNINNQCFSISLNEDGHFLKKWHCHVELEFVIILKSTGTLFIGDNIEKFEEGELYLIGKNLPHKFLNDEKYFQKESKLTAEAIAIHFNEDFLGTMFTATSEMLPIQDMFSRASQGIRFENTDDDLKAKILTLNKKNGFDRIIELLKILNQLAHHKDQTVLSSIGFRTVPGKGGNDVLDKMYDFIFDNFKNNISSGDIANAVAMNHSAFSRFFKRIQGKTVTRYLNEIRIGFACKLLLEANYNISNICYDCGYNNLSNFNRHFKEIKGMSPTNFIKLHKIKNKAK